MQTEELITFEKMEEGVALFNEDGTFDYINQAGAELVWGNSNNDNLYNEIESAVSGIDCDDQQLFSVITLKNVPDNGEINCAVSRVNGHFLAVFSNGQINETRRYGLGRALKMIRNKLYLMNSVYVGGRPIVAQ